MILPFTFAVNRKLGQLIPSISGLFNLSITLRQSVKLVTIMTPY
ncbi:hypothetical protein ACFWDG_16270 [Peribacillus sp. NPDC060186]